MSDLNSVHRAVRDVSGQVHQVKIELGNLAVIAHDISGRAQSTQHEVADVKAKLTHFFEHYLRRSEVQLARTQIQSVRDELQTTYGHYADVRRRAVGILQAVDAGIVTHEAIKGTSEEVMLATPRYWLAPGLVTLAAWARHDRDLATRACAKALERDGKKASLFFALAMRRADRDRATTWLDQYLDRQDPGDLTREFVVVLDAAACGLFGPRTKADVIERLDTWLKPLRTFEGDTHRTRVGERLKGFATAAPFPYPLLQQYSPDAADLGRQLTRAGVHAHIAGHLQRVLDAPLVVLDDEAHRLDALDAILDSLVANFDDEELPLRREEAKLQAIVDADGDLSQARVLETAHLQSLEQHQDLPALLIGAALDPERTHASPQSAALAIGLTVDWLGAAHDQLSAEIRNGRPASVRVVIDGWTGVIAADTPDEAGMVASLHHHIDATTQFSTSRLNVASVAALVLGVVFLGQGLVAGNVAAIAVGLVVLGGALWWGRHTTLNNKLKLDQLRRQRKAEAEEKLRGAIAEVHDFLAAFDTADRRAPEVGDLLARFALTERRDADTPADTAGRTDRTATGV